MLPFANPPSETETAGCATGQPKMFQSRAEPTKLSFISLWWSNFNFYWWSHWTNRLSVESTRTTEIY
jgi:hypothetical protein